MTRSARVRRLMIGAPLVIALAGVMAAPVPVAAAPTDCAVKNVTTSMTSTDLQAAVDAAAGGHTLEVRGYCYGSTTIDRKLAIVGKVVSGVKPLLSGQESARVLRVLPGKTVSVRNLDLTMNDQSVIRDNDSTTAKKAVRVLMVNASGSPSILMTGQSRIRSNSLAAGQGALTLMPDCGAPVTSTGTTSRVVNNTPANVVTATGY